MMQGYCHSIETFGTVDGPGIRYVLFLSGCQMRCVFCHNPDTWVCGGRSISVENVLEGYNRFRPFYQASGGGITVTGGEPLLQAGFVEKLFRRCQQAGIHTILDTAGYAFRKELAKVLLVTDVVSYSIKVVNRFKHRQLTGQDNQEILDNLALAAAHKPVVVRYVVIPNITDSVADLKALADVIGSLPRRVPVELLGYHTMGVSKWATLGFNYLLEGVPAASEKDMAAAAKFLQGQGIQIFHQDGDTARFGPMLING